MDEYDWMGIETVAISNGWNTSSDNWDGGHYERVEHPFWQLGFWRAPKIVETPLGWAASLLTQNSKKRHPLKTRRPPKCLKLVMLGSAQNARTNNFGVHFNAFLARKACLKRA